MSFTALNLVPELLKAVAKSGYDTPTPIQVQAIPKIIAGKDILASAQTGTGKTAGFTLPILHRLMAKPGVKANQARVLILTPTRELAAQVFESVQTYSQFLNIRSACVFGGVNINPQMKTLRGGVDILVATPGRLLDLISRNAVSFPSLECLVLDEADRMLDMGFLPDIKRLIKVLPAKRQTLLFSATFAPEIKALAQQLLHEPVSISVTPDNAAAITVKQWFHPVDKKRKSALLSHLIKENQWSQVLVFARTKRGANKVAYDLEKSGLTAAIIHGNKSQNARTRALKEFKAGKVQVLVATDIAARGLDIDHLPHVINHDLPQVAEDYVHRIGRTGRAGKTGEAISLVSADEIKLLSAIETLIQKKLKRIVVDGFDPQHAVPETSLKPARKKKPHKKKLAKKHNHQTQSANKQAAGKPASSRRKPRRKPTRPQAPVR
jgi:ATP-dependent RNA helicase RhlE